MFFWAFVVLVNSLLKISLHCQISELVPKMGTPPQIVGLRTGYLFYVPDKHLVVSRRDAVFNQAYFPARVGETMLIDTKND